jgi:hypothetical protein
MGMLTTWIDKHGNTWEVDKWSCVVSSPERDDYYETREFWLWDEIEYECPHLWYKTDYLLFINWEAT